MILEQAVLPVPVDRQAAFEEAFAKAISIISASPGFISLQFLKCVEEEGKYLLLVEWESIAAHEEGFRGSDAYLEWTALLHHFYDPFPVVEHYKAAFSA